MFKKIRNSILLGGLGVVAVGACTPLVVHDLANLGNKEDWTLFDKVRVRSYFEPAGLAGSLIPPVGKASGIHHLSLIGNAYFDGDLPPESTMDWFRDVVMNSPGNGSEGNDFESRFKRHEKNAVRSGRTVYISNIVQAVPFHGYGLPFKDHFAISMRTDIVNGEPKSSFIVWGLGIIVDKRNPDGLGPQYDDIASLFNLKGADLIRWTCHIEKEGLAKPYWVLITERSETSSFSHAAVRKTSKQRKREWHIATEKLHREGGGKTVSKWYSAY